VCCLQVTVPVSKVNGFLCLFVGTWFCSGLVCGFCLVLFNACIGSYCVIVLLAFSVVRSKSVLRIAVFFKDKTDNGLNERDTTTSKTLFYWQKKRPTKLEHNNNQRISSKQQSRTHISNRSKYQPTGTIIRILKVETRSPEDNTPRDKPVCTE